MFSWEPPIPRAPSERFLGAQRVKEGALDTPGTGFGENCPYTNNVNNPLSTPQKPNTLHDAPNLPPSPIDKRATLPSLHTLPQHKMASSCVQTNVLPGLRFIQSYPQSSAVDSPGRTSVFPAGPPPPMSAPHPKQLPATLAFCTCDSSHRAIVAESDFLGRELRGSRVPPSLSELLMALLSKRSVGCG